MASDSHSGLNEGNIAPAKAARPRYRAACDGRHPDRSIHLVIDDDLLQALNHVPEVFRVIPRSSCDAAATLESISAGDSMVWIGGGEEVPKELWVGTFRPTDAPLSVDPAQASPLIMEALRFRRSRVSSAFICPPKEMPLHNVDEEVRADLLPILEARDRFGRVVGYPGALMAYYAPSLVGRRFEGSECFFFLFDQPARALAPGDWSALLESIALRFRSGLQLRRVETDYASYQVGERVHVRVRVANLRPSAAATEVRLLAKPPGACDFKHVVTHRRCPDAMGQSEAVCDFAATDQPGLWTLRVEACQDIDRAEEPAIDGCPVPIDRRDVGIVVLNGPVSSPSILSVDGPCICLDGESGFWVGTHYYPSSSWWEWAWRDFCPLDAARDFRAMRRLGYRIVRIWVDPVLDEQALRAMDAAIHLAASLGIVLDICVFTQWVREIGFERPNGEIVKFDFRERQDSNLHSVSFRNLALQREYVRVLARRWKQAGNVVYNLANEAYVRDPDHTQMDKEAAQWSGIPESNGSLRDSLLFRRWASELTAVIRQVGANQPVIPGYMFSLSNGGDSYLANLDADIAPWHCYLGDLTGVTLNYFDPTCANRPIILEEFGTLGWNSEGNYEANTHLALAAGASAAMSYEWGVSRLAPEMSFYPTPLRESVDWRPDPRAFEPYIEIGNSWPSRVVGICATPSGFGYGSIYHGTPFPAAAALALSRLGLMGNGLGRSARPESVYVLIRTAKLDNMEAYYRAFRRLWREKIIFGVWREDCIDSLPDSARVVVCPDGLSPLSEAVFRERHRSGLTVLRGDDWQLPASVPRIEVSSGSEIDLMVRRTTDGSLYVLVGGQSKHPTTIRTEAGSTAALGVDGYAMVHERSSEVTLVEASGEVAIDARRFCRVSQGRAIVASSDNAGLPNAGSVRLVVTHPTRVQFAREIARVSVLDEFGGGPAVVEDRGCRHGCTLDIDAELSRYLLEVFFEAE